MTGTGTQADPYVPSIWSEFVTAIGTQNAYVALAAGTVWDMNEIAPTGVGLITVNAVSIAGNCAEIKNLFFNNGGFKLQYNVTISNLKFINMLAESCNYIFGIDVYEYRYPYLSKVSISGKLVDSTLLKSGVAYDQGRQKMTLSQCAINLEFSGTSAFAKVGTGSYEHIALSACNIKTAGTSSNTSSQTFKIENSLWTGDWVLKYASIVGGSNVVSSNSIFDVNVPSTAEISVNSSYTGNVRQCLINSDKITSGASVAAQLTGVTTEQLHSAAYLDSIGFPIATS